MKWFCFYSEFRSDPKIAIMTPHQQWAFIILLCLASENPIRGRIDGLTDEEIAHQVQMTVEEWLAIKDRFKAKKMIEWDESGIILTHWSNRQIAEKTNTHHIYRKHQSFVFSRDGFKCVYCGSTENLSLDHKIPQSRGGSHDPENLATCCLSCNSSKGAKTPQEWLEGVS